jgi:hypothetical protein
MPEVIVGFSGAESSSERADPAAQTGNSSLGELAQQCLEFAEGHFDDDEDDPANHPPVIYFGNALTQWKKRLDPAHLCPGEQE